MIIENIVNDWLRMTLQAIYDKINSLTDIRTVYDFIDGINLPIVKQYNINGAFEARSGISDQQSQEQLCMNMLYHNELQCISDNNIDGLLQQRDQTRTFIPIYEFYIDLYLMNESARIKYNESSGATYEHVKYIDAVQCFSGEKARDEFHHPYAESDKAWTDGTADAIYAIGRLSWERKYLLALISKLDEASYMNDKKEIRKIKKTEKKNNALKYEWNSNLLTVERYKSDNSIVEQYHQYISREQYDDDRLTVFVKKL